MKLSITNLYEFVIANKGNKTFIGFTDTQIVNLLIEAVRNQLLLYSVDEQGRITGMIMAEKRPNNVLFITENLAMSLSTLRRFAEKVQKMYPNYKLEWLKHGIHKKHDTQQIYRKLTTI
jgi:hypothetical protein